MKVNKYYSKITNKGSYPLEKEMVSLFLSIIKMEFLKIIILLSKFMII